MKDIEYQPQNKEYLSKLLGFAEELFEICQELKIKPVIYGGLAYAFYTKDETININDIDFLVPESTFPNIIDKIKERKEWRYETTGYHSLKVYKNDAKINFDEIEGYYEEYYKDLPPDSVEVSINNVLLAIVSLKSLKRFYKKVNADIPFKRGLNSIKLEKLNAVIE